MKSFYPGIALIGGENTAGIYSVNGGIVDAQGVGIQHLFYKNYEQDLIHTACTLVKIKGKLYYGNRVHEAETHPIHIHSEESCTEKGFMFCDTFSIENGKIKKNDKVFSYGDNIITFETTLENNSNVDFDIDIYAYAVGRNKDTLKASYNEKLQCIISETGERVIGVKVSKPELFKIVEDSPTGFLYRGTQSLFYNEEHNLDLETKCMTVMLLGKKITLKANKTYTFNWTLLVEENKEKLKHQLENINLELCKMQAEEYWRQWLSEGEEVQLKDEKYKKHGEINLIAAKAACIGGFVPADLTGHYFAMGSPSYYARDSMMVARAFMLSGHHREFEEIMLYLINRPTKANGEFCQRYNGKGLPSEGSNNNVFHQLDSIGYFARNIRDYYLKSGKMLLSYEKFKDYVNVFLNNKRKNGMVGPEGGVNEGVFGPAFITSSNMYIYGGLIAAIEIAVGFNDEKSISSWKLLSEGIYKGIQSTLAEDGSRYYYGYVDYNDVVIKKYDTPQYFGTLYGYPNDEGMKSTNDFFLRNASFFQDGIGYSEQEYHHGPWIFNTAACAEYAALTGNYVEYKKKINWIIKHSNAYGLLPEAIDGNDESKCMINPLTWACAEFVSAIFIINTEDGHITGKNPIYKNIN